MEQVWTEGFSLSVCLEWEKWKSDSIRCLSVWVNSSSSRTLLISEVLWAAEPLENDSRSPDSLCLTLLNTHIRLLLRLSSVYLPVPVFFSAFAHFSLYTFLLIYWQWNGLWMVLNSDWNFCKYHLWDCSQIFPVLFLLLFNKIIVQNSFFKLQINKWQ